MNLRALLEQRVTAALRAAGAPDQPALIASAARPEFGDYQANGCMAAAKQLRRSPRELAGAVVAALDAGANDASSPIASAEIAGPGFVNLRLRDNWLIAHATPALAEPHAVADTAERVLVDYSSPNLMKEMHVGHLRSTIIGDALARVQEHLGNRVVRQNHVGDWGTQFGMLISHYVEQGTNAIELADLEAFYRSAAARFRDDAAFAERARNAVVQLQSGDPQTLEHWRRFVEVSLSHCEAVYARLGARLERSDIRGESAYNDDLAPTVQALADAGLLQTSDGAECVFLDEFKGKDDAPLPLIVRKTDGGFLYPTTDLAAIRYRCGELAADRVLYVVDARQTLHFKHVFATARRAGFAETAQRLEHVPFGTMLGADGKPFKTRSGDTVKLAELLDEAERRALALLDKRPELTATERQNIAHAVGIGAVKYADLSKHRLNDYVFDWEQMLSFDGNTAPYLQYACTRIHSLFRRADRDPEQAFAPSAAARELATEERQLALALVRFGETLDMVARDSTPHVLCSYLYELAGAFMKFYERCPVLDGDANLREARLALCAATLAVLTRGLGLLGIATVPRM